MPEDILNQILPELLGDASMASPAAPAVDPNHPIQLGEIPADSPEGLQKQEELVSDLVGTFTSWSAWRRPMEALWGQIYAMFMEVITGQKAFTRARVFVPVAFQIIESAVPKIVNIILGQAPFFEVHPENDSDDPNSDNWTIAKTVQRILDYQLRMASFFTKFVDFTKQLLMYGTSYFLVYWKVRRDWVIERTPRREQQTILGNVIGDKLMWDTKRVYKVVERRPEVEVMDIADVYPDPEARNEDEGSGIFTVTRMPKAEVLEMCGGQFPAYANGKKVEESSPAKGTNQQLPLVKIERRAYRGQPTNPPSQQDDGMVELITFWGRRDLDGDGIREEVMIVIANRQVIVKAGPNPFEHGKRPVIRATLFPVPLEWYGVGLIEPVMPLISEMNTLRNQQIDVNNLIINRMWKVSSLADIDIDTLISVPNGILLTDQMDGLMPLEQQELPQATYAMLGTIQQDIDNTSVPRSAQGTPESGALGRTARGAQLIIGQALEKFGMAAKLIEMGTVHRLLEMIHQLNLQFIDDDSVWSPSDYYASVYDEKVPTEALRAKIKFKMLGVSDTITKEAKLNQMMAIGNFAKNIPGVDMIGMLRTMWSLMDIPEHADKIFQPAPFPTTVVNQMQQTGPDGGPVSAQVQQNGAQVTAAQPGVQSV